MTVDMAKTQKPASAIDPVGYSTRVERTHRMTVRFCLRNRTQSTVDEATASQCSYYSPEEIAKLKLVAGGVRFQ